ncbi:MAG: radical SAM protein [Clostridia bacterium]|nr:radical SAM protein [Clostridia bacterium]
MDVLFVDSEEYEKILSLTSSNTTELYNAGIYIDDSKQDDDALKILIEEFKNNNRKIEVIYFIVSTGCNLKCKYCFEENSKFNNHYEKNMSIETALIVANRYLEYLDNEEIESPQIVFYGGEPLINWRVVKKVIEYISSQNANIKFSIVTNGTLINDEIVNFISNYNIDVGISVDGPKLINDKNRIFRKSPENSVYEDVIKKLELFNKKDIPYNLSITISENLIDKKDEVISWIKKSNFHNIFYNLYHYGGKCTDWENLYTNISEYLIDSYEKLSQFGIIDGRIVRKIDSLLNQKFKFADCAAIGANQITIKPNGDVTICHGYVKTDRYILGNITTQSLFDLINHPSSDDWIKCCTLYKEQCLNCEALYICGGGCSMQSETLFDELKNVDRAFCIHSKKSLIWLLKKLYLASMEQILTKGE